MTPDMSLEWIKVVALIACIVAGAFAVFSPSWVWLRHHAIGTASVALGFFGVILLSAPVYQTMQIKTPTGFEVNFAEFVSEFEELQRRVSAINDNILQIEKNNNEFLQISDKISSKMDSLKSTQSYFNRIMQYTDVSNALQDGTIQDVGENNNSVPVNPVANLLLELKLKEKGFSDQDVSNIYDALIEVRAQRRSDEP